MESSDNEYVVKGPELLEPIPKRSFGKTMYDRLKENYNLPIAMIDSVTRKTISYKNLFEKSLLLAHSLQKYGIGQNDTIAISSENCIDYAFPLVAGLWVGATVTLFNPLYTPREIVHVANISKPTIIFCSSTSIKQILEAQKDLKFVKKIITIDGYEAGSQTLENFIAMNSRDYKRFYPVDLDDQRVAFILYSSGTTGLPKGVMLTHYNLNATLILLWDPKFFIQSPPGTATSLCLLPFFHSFGMIGFTTNLLLGRTLLILTKFDGHSFLKAIQDFKIKTISIVPPIANFLARSPQIDKYNLSHLQLITSGAAPLSNYIQELLLKRFKSVSQIRQGYGLTEATVAAVISPLAAVKQGSVGKLLPATFAKVVDIDTCKPLGPGNNGELYFKGPQIMKGYAGDINSTNSVIDKDGWLHTGDIGYYDEDGYFYVVDRLKELIKYKGFQVAPAELEGILLKHPQITDAAVIGIPDEIAGEVPLAFVVKTEGHNLTDNEVKNFVAEQVTPSKYLRGGVRFVKEIPKNATGKILRQQLRKLAVPKSNL